jgi:nucleotide-binding universal stress UspA family protein
MKILVATDTSPAGEIAIEETAARHWPAGSDFEVVSVIEPSHLWTTSEVAEEAASRAQEVVRKAVGTLRAKGLNAAGAVLFGDARLQILDRASASATDFIIVGSRGLSAINRFLVGNVAATILRHARCSVAIIRARSGKDNAAMKILLAVDGGEFSGDAARSIAERPWPAGTEVRVLSVVQLTLPAAHALFEVPFIDSDVVENARGEAMKHALDAIDSAKKILSAAAVNVSESVSVLLDNPREIILKDAADWGADLIVLGSHGRQGADRFLLGSVSEAVATHAECSVEVIRRKEPAVVK